MNPVQIDVFFPVPEGWGLCNSCELLMAQANLGGAPQDRGLDEYPPEWRQEFEHLSTILIRLADRFQSGIMIRIWDPRSLQGLVKSIQYGVRRYPTFIVDGHWKVTGRDAALIEQNIQAAGAIPEI